MRMGNTPCFGNTLKPGHAECCYGRSGAASPILWSTDSDVKMKSMTANPFRRWQEAFQQAKSIRRLRRVIARRPHKDGFVQSVDGPFLRDTPGDRTFQFCVTGYGRFIPDVIKSQVAPFVFVDIGANCGMFSLLAACHAACLAVTAIEPVPDTFEALEANVAFNCAANIRTVRAVVSARPGKTLALSFNPHHSGLSAIAPEGGAGTVMAPVLDAAALSLMVGRPGCAAVVKIDVEGSEADVIGVLRASSFFPDVTAIVIEMSARNGGVDHVRQTHQLLEAEGFKEAARDGPDNHYDALYVRS